MIGLIIQKKSDLTGTAGINTSKSAKKVELIGLKPEMDKIYVDKAQEVPNDLSKFSTAVKKVW